jgi:hypothetical protein
MIALIFLRAGSVMVLGEFPVPLNPPTPEGNSQLPGFGDGT